MIRLEPAVLVWMLPSPRMPGSVPEPFSRRARAVYEPYRQALANVIECAAARNAALSGVSILSFTPRRARMLEIRMRRLATNSESLPRQIGRSISWRSALEAIH
jgi:hypothetical protein